MVYILKEIRCDKTADGEETGWGEWEILEHFNLSVVARVYLKREAEYIVKHFNKRDALVT